MKNKNTHYRNLEIRKTINDTSLVFHISVSERHVRIHKVMAGERDIFRVIDRQIMKDVHEELMHTYIINVA